MCYNSNMRSIINISVPTVVKKEIETAVRKGGYATKSEFIRDLMRLWKERQLFESLQESRRDIALGKGKLLRSLKSLR